jgi:UDP:flavonoid glycosyltransferase YjiC (YdhE family)
MARIVLATFGSLGDLHPFLALALRLRAAGHQPVIATAALYREKVEAEGLEFAAVRPDFGDLERDLGATPEETMVRMIAGEDFLFREVLFPYVRVGFEDSLRAIEGADMVVTTNFAFGARLAAEVRGVPLVAAVLQPAVFLSRFDPPSGPYPLMNRLVGGVGPVGRGVLREVVKGVVAGWATPVHALRRELGLPRVRDLVFDGQSANAVLTLGLYSPLLGAPQPDFPPRTRLTGFCFYDSEAGAASRLSPELERFLSAGPAPLVFSLGSTAVLVGEAVYRRSLEAARALGERAVLLVGERALERWRDAAGADVFVSAYEPHGALFPRARVIAHHGGAGTSAQALRAGVPQLVTPFMADQPDNAARLVRLGLARTLPPRRYTAKRAAAQLRALSREPAYAEAARRAGAAITLEDGAGAAVTAIEGVLGARRAA